MKLFSYNGLDVTLDQIKNELFDISFELKRHGDYLIETIDEYVGVENKTNRLSNSILSNSLYYNTKTLNYTQVKGYGQGSGQRTNIFYRQGGLRGVSIPHLSELTLKLPSEDDDEDFFSTICGEKVLRSAEKYRYALYNSDLTKISDKDDGIGYIQAVCKTLNLPNIFVGVTESEKAAYILKEHGADNGWFNVTSGDATEMTQEGYPVIVVHCGFLYFYYLQILTHGIISTQQFT